MSLELTSTPETDSNDIVHAVPTLLAPRSNPVFIDRPSENEDEWYNDNFSPTRQQSVVITDPPPLDPIKSKSTSYGSYDSAATEVTIANNRDSQSTIIYPPISKLLLNETFCARMAILFVITFLWFVTILYAIGQILSLHLTNYWCPQMTLHDVRQNSIEQQEPEGIANSCWRSDSIFTVDQDALWSNESYSFELELTFKTCAQSLAFAVLSMCFLGSIVYIIKATKDDIKWYRKDKLGKREYLKWVQFKQKSTQISLTNNCFIEFCSRVNRFYKMYFEVDSGRWCFLMVVREIIEIVLQSLALLLYNGTFLFGNPRKDDIRLAHSAEYVEIFTVFLCANCIIAGILWILYALKPYLCHGVLFYLIASCVDALFDIFYAIYPLIIVISENEPTILTTLAALQTNSATAFLVTFVPMIFLLFKFLGLSNKVIGSLRKHYANIYAEKLKQADQNVQLHAIAPQLTANNVTSWVINDMSLSTKSTTDLNMVDQLQDYLKHIRYKYYRKFVIIFVGLLFMIYGAVVSLRVFQHFDHAKDYCHLLTDQQNEFRRLINDNTTNVTEYEFTQDVDYLLHDNSELFLFEFCENKVYPFNINGRNDICQCRNFRFHQEEFEWSSIELEEYFGIDLVEIGMNVFRKWYMLEKVEFKDVESVYRPAIPRSFNFTSDMFNAKELKAFRFEESNIGHIDNKISNWKSLVHFEIARCSSFRIPSTISKLVRMESFINTGNFQMETLNEGLCDLNRLKVIDTGYSTIQSIPHCFASIDFQSLIIEGSAVRDVPLGLFNIIGLKRLRMGVSGFNLDDLMNYNNISSQSEFNDKFEWNRNTSFDLDGSRICLDNDNNSAIQEFLDYTNSCHGSCDGYVFTEAQCLSLWQNGVCDAGCNTVNCHWDGGDCLQLCECLKDENDYLMLGDGHCDPRCNTTNCNYDQYDCIDTSDNFICSHTYNLGQHNCNPDWVGDDWCDANCQYISLCDHDGGDCDQHSCDPNAGKQCEYAYDLFNLIGNLQDNDDHISIDEWCNMWPLIEAVGAVDFDYFNKDISYFNCTTSFNQADLDNNDLLSFYESLITSSTVQDISIDKAVQLNCSKCISSGVQDYYT